MIDAAPLWTIFVPFEESPPSAFRGLYSVVRAIFS
jgi:hypothetical protein